MSGIHRRKGEHLSMLFPHMSVLRYPLPDGTLQVLIQFVSPSCRRSFSRWFQPRLQMLTVPIKADVPKQPVPQDGTVKNFKPREQLATDTTSSRPEWLKCGTLFQTTQSGQDNNSRRRRDWRGHPNLYNYIYIFSK